jgi:tRNA pseudouridine38-40 synthase
MSNYKLIIEYDGTNYSGWQIQPHKRTIQQELEKHLSKIFNQKIKITGSGRTDAGVHALGQVANFKVSSGGKGVSNIKATDIKKALNAMLDKDIRIKSVTKVKDDFHARFSAKKKIYRYQMVLTEPSVFERFYFAFVPYKLNVALMRKEAKDLLGRHDFKCFQGSGRLAKDTIRVISKVSLVKKGNKLIVTIEGNGFLYNMVRNIAGTLIEIGRGKFPQGTVKKLIRGKDRRKSGPTAKACGVVLVGVKY